MERLSGQDMVTVDTCDSCFAKKFKTSIRQILNKFWIDFKLNSFLPAGSLENFEVNLPSDFKLI